MDFLSNAIDISEASTWVRKGAIPSASLGASKGGQRLTVGVGSTNDYDDVTRSQRYPLGCLMKVLIALVASVLEKDGKLSFDESLANFSVGIERRDLNLLHFLTHSAGYTEPVCNRWKMEWSDLSDCINRGSAFTPGSAFSYAQSGAAVTAMVIEKVVGRPLASIFNERIGDIIGIDALPESLVHVPSSRDAKSYVWLARPGKLMPYRMPKDEGLFRYSISGLTFSIADILKIGEYILSLSKESLRRNILQTLVNLPRHAGAATSEATPDGWTPTIGRFGSIFGQTGSYVVSTSSLYIDPEDQLVTACSMNTWDPLARQAISIDLLNQCGSALSAPANMLVSFPFQLGEIAGTYLPLMWGMPQLHINDDGKCTGAFEGQFYKVDGGVSINTLDKVLALAIQRHPQSGAPMIHLGMSVYIRSS